MATETFVDFTGLQYYDGKLKEKIASEYAKKSDLPSSYQGATSSANGVAGLVPAAPSADREKFLRGDGTWEEMFKEVGYSTTEPTSSSIASLDNESVIFYETQSMSSGAASPAPISITGNAATASSVGHSMSISVDGGAVEGASLYTFNGSAEKTMNIAGGTGISLTGVSGTVTINANPFRGATASVNGAAGMVPASTVAEKDRFLRGDGTWAEVSLPDVYQGATNSSSGIAGLVPAASSAERERFLKGDGTWAEVVQPAIVTSSELSTGTDATVRTISPKVIHDYVAGEVAAGVAGLVNSAPATLDTLNELAAALGNDANFATTVSTSLGTCVANIEKTTRTASEQQLASDTLLVSCTNEVLQQISTYYSSNSIERWIYDGNYFSENGSLPASYDASVNIKIQKYSTKWTLETEPAIASLNNGARSYTGPHDMPFGTHVIDIWENNNPLFVRVEYILTNSGEVTFTRYDIYSASTNTVSRRYSDLLISKKNSSTIQLDLTYTGATSSASGISGFVPSALSSEKDFYLKGDGTWAELTLPNVYQGATSSASGVTGLVPAATSAQKDCYLAGNGSWTSLEMISNALIDELFDPYEWKVQFNSGSYPGSGMKIPFCLYGTTNTSISVDWGDGSAIEEFTSATAEEDVFPSHTYSTANTTYTITFSSLSWRRIYICRLSNLDLVSWQTGIRSIVTPLPPLAGTHTVEDDYTSWAHLDNVLEYTFYRCSGLTTIPAYFLQKNPDVTSFSYCFAGCSSIATVPNDLLSYSTSIQNLNRFMCQLDHNTMSLGGFEWTIPSTSVSNATDIVTLNSSATRTIHVPSGSTTATTLNAVASNYGLTISAS